MTELPEWIRKAKERADKWGQWQPITGLGDGNDLIRTDVPRLLELVGEMAEKLEGAVTVLDDIAAYGYDISKVPNIVKEAILGRQALAKYHGEAEPTTPNESYWWCESCGCEVDGTRVTYEELHDVCGHPVEWRGEAGSE